MRSPPLKIVEILLTLRCTSVALPGPNIRVPFYTKTLSRWFSVNPPLHFELTAVPSELTRARSELTAVSKKLTDVHFLLTSLPSELTAVSFFGTQLSSEQTGRLFEAKPSIRKLDRGWI